MTYSQVWEGPKDNTVDLSLILWEPLKTPVDNVHSVDRYRLKHLRIN